MARAVAQTSIHVHFHLNLLRVRGALPDRAGARGAFRRRDVAVQPALDVLVGVPVDEPVMVAGNEHLPLVGWQVTAAGPQPAVLVGIPLGPGPAIYVRAGVGRMPQRRQYRLLGRLHPGDLGQSPAHGSGLLQPPRLLTVLRQASLPADTTIPWWHGRRLHFEFS